MAEHVHRTLIGRAARGRSIVCPELTGQNRFGQPLSQGHRHAHILPLDLDDDRRLDHILIWAPMGLGPTARQAVRSLRHLAIGWPAASLGVTVVGCGDLNRPQAAGGTFQRAARWLTFAPRSFSACRLAAPGVPDWISATPFVPPRHIKKSARNSLKGQIQAELASRGLPAAQSIDVLPHRSADLADFVRVRCQGRKRPPADVGYAVRLRFHRPLAGPIVLGYGCHFGLGLFQAGSSPCRHE